MKRTEKFEDDVIRWLVMITCLISGNFLYSSGFLEGLYLKKLLVSGILGLNILVIGVIGSLFILGMLEKLGSYVLDKIGTDN
ncbi:hypothetical protein MMMIC1C10_11350 [Methanococcus maripaludis]|jgi:hypothetical protein|uniref:hypothetical protein n=1 Tax=Methanococcus maripaludis TaxID=39152 RepID=UPI003143485F